MALLLRWLGKTPLGFQDDFVPKVLMMNCDGFCLIFIFFSNPMEFLIVNEMSLGMLLIGSMERTFIFFVFASIVTVGTLAPVYVSVICCPFEFT